MKNISEHVNNLDRDQVSRIGRNLPGAVQAKPQLEQVALIINSVFAQLLATFPAAMANRTQSDLDVIRGQWVLAFSENGITSMEQVKAGLRVARRQEKPFLPSPGQFVAWCKSEEAVAVGLPDANELIDMIYQYCRTRGSYPDAESYPWPDHKIIPPTLKHRACYWLVTSLYSNMRANALSDPELRRKASEELSLMVRRIKSGEVLPDPMKQLPKFGGKPITGTKGLNKIAEIRAKFGLGRG